VILITVYFERELFSHTDIVTLTANKEIMQHIFAYAAFAFFATMIREMIKDLEDMKGDAEFGRKTFPVVMGVLATKWAVTGLIAFLIALLFFLQQIFFRNEEFFEAAYIFIFLQLPLAAIVFSLVPSREADDFRKLSAWMKIVTLAGILSIPIFYLF
jgi:4-hydroxybenzoate polyprenyltransferase